ncbi:hypothetical protein, partial [Neisseria meningitidis]|uniref:hypothetical protein n=1 Tax=Neisseria meningitidis TaxID=487 RepID=UPI001C5656B6
RLRGNDEVEVTRNLKQAKPNEPDSHFRGNDGIYVGMTGFEIAAFIGSNRSRSAVIPTKVGIQFFEFQSFPINCLSIECLDSRLRGNDDS